MFSKFLPMPLIKLDATSSTNDFLKEMAGNQPVENYTVVTAELQTGGRGQMGAAWHSEKGKNLMMSMLVRDSVASAEKIYHLNVAVATAVIATLESFEIPSLAVKWPNDIMSGNKKIGGILIESTFRNNGEISSIVGIGVNINQTNFENLPQASSLKVQAGRDFDKDQILNVLVKNLKSAITGLESNYNNLWETYRSQLFRKDIPTAFEDQAGKRFMGIIKTVNDDGKLAVLLENDTLKTFSIREIKMLY
jgi:BirA family biotin operon repressor/biotin-[acetyl-CoA-carboxylase] ligase